MAVKPLNASPTKSVLVFLVCIVVLAPLVKANMAVVIAAPSPSVIEDFSLLGCASFISEATECVKDVFNKAIAPHPSCCTAISKLNDCSSKFLKNSLPTDMVLIKKICASWGISIS